MKRRLILFFFCVIAYSGDLYSGQNDRNSPYKHTSKKVGFGKDRQSELRTRRITGSSQESCSLRQCVGAAIGFVFGFTCGCFAQASLVEEGVFDENPRQQFGIPIATGMGGAAVGSYLFAEKKRKKEHRQKW
jgi:hypothetical protein